MSKYTYKITEYNFMLGITKNSEAIYDELINKE